MRLIKVSFEISCLILIQNLKKTRVNHKIRQFD